jgi:hypothetical protein
MKFLNMSIFYFTKYLKNYKNVTEEKETKFARIGPAHQVAPVGVNAKFITTCGD